MEFFPDYYITLLYEFFNKKFSNGMIVEKSDLWLKNKERLLWK